MFCGTLRVLKALTRHRGPCGSLSLAGLLNNMTTTTTTSDGEGGSHVQSRCRRRRGVFELGVTERRESFRASKRVSV